MANLKYKHTAYTSAEWASLNPVIVENEIVIESDTKRTKIGNGISTYNQLEYADANSVGNSLGSIKPTDAAPTPQRNGNYTFSIGGNKPAWLTAEAGITEVKAGDGVAVVYTDPSSYTYTHLDTGSSIEQARSQSTSKVPSSKLLDDELKKLENTDISLGLRSLHQTGTVIAGVNSGSNTYFTDKSELSTTKKIAFRLLCEDNVINKYTVVGYSGVKIDDNLDYWVFEPNKWYFVYPTADFLAQIAFGAYIDAANAIGNGSFTFDLYYDYETSIITYNEIGILETDVSSLKSKNTELGFDTMRTSKTVTAGVASDSRAFTNVSNLSTLKKIAFILRCADGIINKYAFIGFTAQDIEGLTNYYRFEPNKWYYAYPHSAILTNPPMGAYIDSANAIGNGSYTFDIYYDYETGILPKTNTKFLGIEIFSICDSLGTIGIWQSKFAALSGAKFDNSKNIDTSKPLSIGGTPTVSNEKNCGQWRARNFVNNYPTAKFCFIENINDMNFISGSISDSPFMLSRIDNYTDQGLADDTAANNYWATNFATIVAGYLPVKGAVINIPFYGVGKNVKITGLPTSNGNISLIVNNITYSIAVTTSDTVGTLIAKILEYQYELVTDAANNDQESVDFYYQYGVTITFNAESTGMTVAITDTSTAQVFLPRYFVGDANLTDWNDPSKWTGTRPTLYSAMKGLIEYMQTNMPLCLLVWLIPTRFGVSATSYLRPDGTQNIEAYKIADAGYQYFCTIQKEICEYYNICYVDLNKNAGISLYNFLSYYEEYNVHPKQVGYEKWGEVIFQLLN